MYATASMYVLMGLHHSMYVCMYVFYIARSNPVYEFYQKMPVPQNKLLRTRQAPKNTRKSIQCPHRKDATAASTELCFALDWTQYTEMLQSCLLRAAARAV
jgi:hypothetical protein